MFRRFSCLSLACAVLFCVSAPASATGMEMGGAGGIGIPIIGNVNLDVVDFFDYVGNIGTEVWNSFRHKLHEDVCPCAPQLNGGHKFQPVRTLKDGQVGLYYQCEYCGQSYGEALEEAYQEYVETLPSSQYNSSGAFLWYPGAADYVDEVVVRGTISSGSTQSPFSVSYPAGAFAGVRSCYVDMLSACVSLAVASRDVFDVSMSTTSAGLFSFKVYYGRLRMPVTGYYTSLSGATSVANVAFSSGDTLPLTVSSVSNASFNSGRSFTRSFVLPTFSVVPLVIDGGNTYELITRVCGSADNNQGLYGYVENGQLYQSTVGTIYNETSNVYQNPVTGDTSNVESWTYDYSDRSYTLTTDEGDEITVTYGDSNVTINEGGTTYNVYYLMEETDEIREELESACAHDYSSTLTTPPTCTASGVRTFVCDNCGASYTQTVPPTGHNYQSAVTMTPTCVNTGVRTFTCSECGDSYTVSIASTGHTWETVRTVPTTYDNDTGQLVQQGYTLYECSVCHEQYRIDADSGGSSLPAPSSGGTSTDSAGLMELDSDVGKGFLATIAHGLTNDLPEAVKAASSWFVELPKLYEGYTGFLGASIAWLPVGEQALIRFAVGFVTFVGIIRRLFGRG